MPKKNKPEVKRASLSATLVDTFLSHQKVKGGDCKEFAILRWRDYLALTRRVRELEAQNNTLLRGIENAFGKRPPHA